MESIKSADIVQTAHRMPAPSDMTPSLAEQCRTNQDETEAKEQCEPDPTPGQGTEQVTVKSTLTDPAPGAVASEDNAVDSPSAGDQGGELPDTAGLEAPDKPDEARENRDPDEADTDMILQDKKQEAGEEDAESSNASMTVTDDAPPLEHLVPRPYQAECIALMNAQTGGRHLIVLATGLGKTVVGAFIRKGQKVLWLSHRDELVEQPRKYFEFEGWTYGIEKAQTMSHGEDIVSASVQTLCRDDRLHRFNPDAFDTIIVDEAHHAAAPSYRKILAWFKPKVVFGFTATPRRGDKIRLTDEFDDILYERNIRWGIRNGYLCDIRAMRVIAGMNLQSVKTRMGDFNETALADQIARSNAVQIAAKSYLTYCAPENRHTLIFTVSVRLCEAIRDAIQARLPDEEKDSVAILTGSTPSVIRRAILKTYQEGSIRCIINCMVLTEGADLPITDAIINLRPTVNPSLYQQMVGRGLRLYPGKQQCLVLDVIGTSSKAHVLCTAPTLFGIDPERLTKKQRSQMDNVSLSRFADMLDEAAADIDIRTQEINAFTGQFVESIFSGESPLEVPEELQEFVVSIGATETSRYIIHLPDGEARMSEMNVLGQTDLRLYHFGHLYAAKTISMDCAAKVIRDWVHYMMHDREPFMWRRASQSGWNGQPMTVRQKQALKSLNSDLFGNALNGRMKQLDKGKASALISLGYQAKKELAALSEPEQELSAAETAPDARTKAEQQFDQLCRQIERRKADSKNTQTDGRPGQEPLSVFTYHVHDMYGSRYRKRTATPRQAAFYQQLLATKRAHGFIFLNAPEGSQLQDCLISPCLDLLRNMPIAEPHEDEPVVLIDMDDVFSQVWTRLKREEADDYVLHIPYRKIPRASKEVTKLRDAESCPITLVCSH